MKTKVMLLLLLLLAAALPAQDKSVTPIPSRDLGTLPHPHSTRAVVVGISDYQDKGIPPLQFAHRDAEAFANWLQSPAGGNIPADNIRLLTNENATNSAIIMALYALMRECQEGDQVVIYFSGHGDVDSKIISQDGYLLAYDTPASVYMAGAVELGNLQKVVSTLSVNKKASVLVITDACHSGKLAGSAIGGTAATAQALAKQFAGEVKIMSCQPNEYSLEGIQWGGGRGLFSFHLLHGLTGLANLDGDGVVDLFEIQRYLEDKVSAEAGRRQFPMTIGERRTPLARVDAHSLAVLVAERKKAGAGDLAPVTMKGLEDEVLAKADAATRQQYTDYKNALATKTLLEPAGDCAWDLFQKLSVNPQVKPLQQMMRHNLAVALLDEVQQALNALMTDDPYEVNQWRYNRDKYDRYPELVTRTIELLGKEHPLYHSLEAKRLFFEAYGITVYPYGDSGRQGPDSLKQLARERLHRALQHDTLAPYVWYLLGNTYLGTFQEDSLAQYYWKAMALAPAWVLPHIELAWDYLDTYWNFDRAGTHIHQALALRPNSYQALEMLSWWHQRYDQADSIEAIAQRMRALRPDLLNDYWALAFTDVFDTGNYERAERYMRKVIATDSRGHFFLAVILFKTRRFEEAFHEMAIAQAYDKNDGKWDVAGHFLNIQDWQRADSLWRDLFQFKKGHIDRALVLAILGKIQVQMGRLDTAKILLQSALDMIKNPVPAHTVSMTWLGVIAQKQSQPEEAEDWFRRAVALPPELWTYQRREDGAELFALYGDFLADQNRFPEAEEKYRKSIELDHGNYIGYYAMARFRARRGKQTEALDYLEKALDCYYPIPGPIYEEPFFAKIRNTKRFKTLMTKHFPKTTPLKN